MYLYFICCNHVLEIDIRTNVLVPWVFLCLCIFLIIVVCRKLKVRGMHKSHSHFLTMDKMGLCDCNIGRFLVLWFLLVMEQYEGFGDEYRASIMSIHRQGQLF